MYFVCRDVRAGGVAASPSLQSKPGRKGWTFAPERAHVAERAAKIKSPRGRAQ
jgi:hypothetical protein